MVGYIDDTWNDYKEIFEAGKYGQQGLLCSFSTNPKPFSFEDVMGWTDSLRAMGGVLAYRKCCRIKNEARI